MVAGAGALVYWLWKKNKSAKEPESSDISWGEVYEMTLKSKCENSGGNWVQPQCIKGPCRGYCADKSGAILFE